jgi:hypothetical protein
MDFYEVHLLFSEFASQPRHKFEEESKAKALSRFALDAKFASSKGSQ